MKYVLRCSTMAFALFASMSFASAATLVTNGDFSGGQSNWGTTGNVGVINEHSYDGINGVAQPGSNFWAVFGGGQQPGGSLFQTIDTVVNQVYRISFSFGGWGDTSPQSINVSIGDLNQTLTAAAADLTKSWATIAGNVVTLQFTANSDKSLLSFTDASASSINADSVITHVSIQAVPGPEAGAGLGALALGGLAFWTTRRRQNNVRFS